MSEDTAAIRAGIRREREELGRTLAALSERADIKTRLGEHVQAHRAQWLAGVATLAVAALVVLIVRGRTR